MSATTDIVPASNMAALDTLDVASREVAITGMLDQARTWLAHAVESSAPAQDIADFKAYIATAAETARRLKVSKEIQVDAEVMVRRTERALGQAIREGQERGEITSRGDGGYPAHRTSSVREEVQKKVSPDEYLPNGQLAHETYAMTDGVTDEQFDQALDTAVDEGNVSRANVVRKVREVVQPSYRDQQDAKWDRVADLAEQGWVSAQIAREVGMGEEGLRKGARQRGIDIRADRTVGRSRRLDTNRIIRESVAAVEALLPGLDLINPDDIDPEEAQTWVDSLTTSISALSKAKRTIKESIQ